MADRDARRAGLYVLARRGELGMTQEQLARSAQVDPKTVNSFEHGESWPWARNIARLETALGWAPLSLETVAAGGEPEIAGDRTAEPPFDAAPQCEYERRIFASDFIDDRQKRLIVQAHREEGHGWCDPGQRETKAAEASLPAASLRDELRPPADARSAAG